MTVVTGAERRLAVEQWLLAAAPDRRRAREEWGIRGLAMLPCGSLFAAARLSAGVVQRAAGGTDDETVDHYLDVALLGGRVIADRYAGWFYALVPASTTKHWRVPESVCLGVGSDLGVPLPGVGAADQTRVYWSVELSSPGELCLPSAVSQVVMTGRYRAVSRG